jgi:hypothetical protein
MRAAVLRQAELEAGGQEPTRDGGWLPVAWGAAGSGGGRALVLAVAVLIALAATLAWIATREPAKERGMVRAAIDAQAVDRVDKAGEPPEIVAEQAPTRNPVSAPPALGPDRASAGEESVAPVRADQETLVAASAAAAEARTEPVLARAEAGEPTRPPRVRRLDFETPSGRKIHWVLNSEFRGVADR